MGERFVYVSTLFYFIRAFALVFFYFSYDLNTTYLLICQVSVLLLLLSPGYYKDGRNSSSRGQQFGLKIRNENVVSIIMFSRGLFSFNRFIPEEGVTDWRRPFFFVGRNYFASPCFFVCECGKSGG